MKIPFLDLRRVNDELDSEIRGAIAKVLHSGWYILGNMGEVFEKNLARDLSKNPKGLVVGCNSGTDAIILSLLAAGVTYGDEVITVSHTAVPTVAAVCAVGATPVFVDVDPLTWVMDIDKISPLISNHTKAIIAVHLYGNMVDTPALARLLQKIDRSEIVIIEDAAQAHGSSLGGCQAGTYGQFGCFSFYPSKNVGALGDGGAIYCHDPVDYDKLRMLRQYGQEHRYYATTQRGINSRLDEIQAAILDVKLPHLNKWNVYKKQLVDTYRQNLGNIPISFQAITSDCDPAWHLCVIRVANKLVRDQLQSYLLENDIQTLIHYPVPNHKQPSFFQGQSVSLPVTENLAECILSIPMNVMLSEAEQQKIISVIQEFFKKTEAIQQLYKQDNDR